MHACNCYWQKKEGLAVGFVSNSEKIFFEKYSEMNLFAQTSSATFRNFWNDKILSYTEQITGDLHSSFMQGDSFRNFVAMHYGKACYDNFFGSFYTFQEKGIWSELTDFDQSLISIQDELDRAFFARDYFHNNDSMMFCFKNAAQIYFGAIDSLHKILNDLTGNDFHAKRYAVDMCKLDGNDINAAFRFLMKTEQILRSLNVVRVKKL